MQQGVDPVDVSSIREKASVGRLTKPDKQTSNTTIADSDLIPSNDSELAVRTLESLIQLGQQILNVLNSPQPQETAGSKKKR